MSPFFEQFLNFFSFKVFCFDKEKGLLFSLDDFKKLCSESIYSFKTFYIDDFFSYYFFKHAFFQYILFNSFFAEILIVFFISISILILCFVKKKSYYNKGLSVIFCNFCLFFVFLIFCILILNINFMASIHASNFVEVQFFMNQFSEVFPFSYVLFFFDNHFTVSFKTQYFKLLITFCIFFFLIFSKIYSLHEKSFAFYEFYILVLLSFLGMFLFISSNSLISLYLSLELMSLTFYIMAASKRYTTFSTEASLKYFILSSLASCIILYGMSLVYGFSGLIYFDDLKIFLDQSLLFSGYDKFLHFYVFDYYGPNDIDYLNLDSGFLLGLILITIGFLFKIGAAPFHVWVPDVYEGAPLPVTLFFAILPKIVFAFFFLNFLNNIIFVEAFSSTYLKPFAFIFLFCGVLSFFVGSFGALYQSKIKRLLAFSAISNVGFFCFSFLLSSFYGSFVEIIFGLFVFIISYVFLTFLIFFLILNLRRYNNNIEVKKILDLENLFKINPAFSIIFALSFFSLAGIPPLLGFFGKFFILSPLVEYNFYFIALFILVFSVISSFYYIRIIKIIFFSKKNTWTFFKPISRSSSFILVFFSFFNIFFVLNPSFFLEFLYKVALVFCL